MLLPIEYESVVDTSVEMDGELGNAGDRLTYVDEVGGTVVEHELAGDTQVAVEPRVVQDAAVHLDAELFPALGSRVRSWLDPQTRRVGVRPHQTQRRLRSRR